MIAVTWMKHTGHGGIADLPDTPLWRANGWEPTDERPPEPDLLTDPPPTEPAPESTEAPGASAPGLSAAQTEKPATAAKTKKEADRG